MKRSIVQLLVVAVAFVFAQVGYAQSKALIDMAGGTPKPALAKSWKKVKQGEYEFELDTTQEVKKGVKVSPAVVKSSLESKLGTTLGVKVTEKGPAKVAVTYTGDEQGFLDKVSKTKIRAGGDVELALESSVSEGGIRAKKPDRAANPGEVKGIVLKAAGGTVTLKVTDSKADKVKKDTTIKVKTSTPVKVKDNVFFVPEKDDKGTWVPKAGTFVVN